MNLKDLSIEEKIGQMFIVGIDGKEVNEKIKKLIMKYKVGGFILYKKNYKTYDEMIRMINTLKEINSKNKIPLFISVDQEGGRVDRMPNEINKIYNAKKISASKDIEIVKEAASITGKMLKDSGYNMNFAPVLDIQTFKDEHAIGNRCFGDNYKDVSKYGIVSMQSLEKEEIIPVIKHFPGHGASKKDSHYNIPKIKLNKKEMELHMKPFEESIKNGAEAIIIGHLLTKCIDRKNVASLSKKIIINNLKKKYRYKGLIITDNLDMKSVKFRYGYERAIKKALLAGNDIVLSKDIYSKLDKIYKWIINGNIKQSKINRSVNKIIDIKKKYNITDDKLSGCNIIELNKQIDNLNNRVDKRIIENEN